MQSKTKSAGIVRLSHRPINPDLSLEEGLLANVGDDDVDDIGGKGGIEPKHPGIIHGGVGGDTDG